MTSGPQVAGGRICEEYPPHSLEPHVLQLFCPVRCPWPAITAHTAPGRRFSPPWNGEEALGAIGSFARARGWRDRGRLGTHSFRRGAAWAATLAGGSFAQLLRARKWRSSAYHQCFDLGREDARAMVSILVGASGDEVPDGHSLPSITLPFQYPEGRPGVKKIPGRRQSMYLKLGGTKYYMGLFFIMSSS